MNENSLIVHMNKVGAVYFNTLTDTLYFAIEP